MTVYYYLSTINDGNTEIYILVYSKVILRMNTVKITEYCFQLFTVILHSEQTLCDLIPNKYQTSKY